jgi:hypothetical protein
MMIAPVPAAAGVAGTAGANDMPLAAGAAGISPAGTNFPMVTPIAPTSMPDVEPRLPAAPANTVAPVAAANPPPPITARTNLMAGAAPAKIEGPRLILLYIRETGDRARDTRRLRILYGLLTSYPGTDHFAFHISEAERTYRLEFPTNTTSWTAELERQILHLVGAGCIEIQPLTVQ